MREDKDRFELEARAAILIQSQYRGLIAREETVTTREFEQAGATIVAAVRQSKKLLDFQRIRAAVALQRRLRGMVARKQTLLKTAVVADHNLRAEGGEGPRSSRCACTCNELLPPRTCAHLEVHCWRNSPRAVPLAGIDQ